MHLDMDAFFAQIEERENPRFKGKPLVVGSDPKSGMGRGVVSTANYEARKYGIHSALPISIAFRLCPNAIFLPVNMELYKEVSGRIFEIFKKYSSQYQIVSLDEGYLDISFANLKEAKKIAESLKNEIFEKEKLTCSVGIGENKLIAKLAAEKSKPNGLKIILAEESESFLEPLDIEDLYGVGPKTAAKIRALGVNKIGELRKISLEKLREMLGKPGVLIFDCAKGKDQSPVISNEELKSIGKEITFEKDTRDPKIIFDSFEEIISGVFRELKEGSMFFKTLTVRCRYFGFETHTKSKTLKDETQSLEILRKEAKNLLLRFLVEKQKPIRLIGLRLKVGKN